MAKAPKMAIGALVLSLLALPAFGVRREGLERISFSSQPVNPLDHRPAGLIEDECDGELRSLAETFRKTCERHATTEANCSTEAKNTIEHMIMYLWQDHLASKVLDAGKTPVFWAGFWPGGEEGIDTRKALADFISSVNGFQLADTEWGQAAESTGANNLENCTWDRKKSWWNTASIMMAQAMADHNVKNIIIALHKTLHGKFSFYKTILYQAELPNMGMEMVEKYTWNPEFEVHSITVKGAPPDESGCTLASEVKDQLERHAGRPVTVWCRPCTTLQSCGPKQQVKKKEMEAECIEGDCQNGQGTKTWADDEIYQGGFKNGLRDGQGTFTWADGAQYQGQYKNDKKDGQGTYTYEDGSMYQGQFKNGKKDGQGTYTFADGAKYQGAWKNDLKEGQGTHTLADGKTMYQGAWKNNKIEGQGTFTWASGTKYHGPWKKGNQDGQGIMTYADGSKYKVWFKEGHIMKKVKTRW